MLKLSPKTNAYHFLYIYTSHISDQRTRMKWSLINKQNDVNIIIANYLIISSM